MLVFIHNQIILTFETNINRLQGNKTLPGESVYY